MGNTHHSQAVAALFFVVAAIVNLVERLLKLIGCFRPKNMNEVVERRKIMWRYKACDWAPAAAKHFLTFHAGWEEPAELLTDPNLGIYAADSVGISFVRLPGPLAEVCHPERSPFAWQTCYREAMEVLRISHDALAASVEGAELSPQLVLVSSVGRCGGTLLMREAAALLGQDSLCLAECPSSMAFDQLLFDLPLTEVAPLLRNALLALLNHRGYERVVIKAFPLAPAYAELLAAAFPGRLSWLVNERQRREATLASYLRFVGSAAHIRLIVTAGRLLEGVNALLYHWAGLPIRTLWLLGGRSLFLRTSEEFKCLGTELMIPRMEDTVAMLVAWLELELRRIRSNAAALLPPPHLSQMETMLETKTAKDALRSLADFLGVIPSEEKLAAILKDRVRNAQTTDPYYAAISQQFRSGTFEPKAQRRISRLFQELELPGPVWPDTQ